MRVKVMAIEEDDWRSYPYFMRVEDGIWLPEDEDFLAGRGTDWESLIETFRLNGLTVEQIDGILTKLDQDGAVEVEGIYIEVPEAEPYNPINAAIESFERYGYILDEDGNPAEIDAENSPLRQAGLI